MKKNYSNLFLFLVLAALILVGSASKTWAQFPAGSYTNNFDTGGSASPFVGSGSVASWLYWYSTPGTGNVTNDVNTPDPLAGPGAGSLEVDSPFYGAGGTQNLFFGTFGNQYGYDFSIEANLLNFDTVSFDIYVGPNQVPDSSGNFGTITVGVINSSSYGFEAFGNGALTIPGTASNGWVHLSVPIDHTIAGITQIPGIVFDYNNYGGYPTTNLTFWIGGLVMHYTGAPPPPPTLSLAKPVSGLNVIDSSSGAYDRETVMSTITSGNSWIGSSGPVTYSFTINSFPNSTAYPGFGAFMFLIPGPYSAAGAQTAPYQYIPSYETAPDYNETNLVFLDIENGTYTTTNGSTVTTNQGAVAYFRYKVNEGGGNTMVYGSGTLGGVDCPSVVGTWSLTFNNNTNVTLTAPNGTNATFTMPTADAAAFSDAAGFSFLIGSQPNSTANVGQSVVYSAVQIQGASASLSDNFLTDSSLNTNQWAVLAVAPPGVLVVPANAAYWVNWTVPDAGFSLQATTNLADSTAWFDPGLAPVGQVGDQKQTLIPAGILAGNQGYFQLIQRTFTGLLVVLPGETLAPGTATGKTGTPTSVSLSGSGGLEPVTVYAVDSTYHVVNGVNDSINLTSDDDGPLGGVSPNALTMVNGVVTFTGSDAYAFSDQGTFIITATDSSSGSIPAATSSPVTVGP